MRPLPGKGPQVGTLGIEEYLSQSNYSVEIQEKDEKFRFIYDLSIIEIIDYSVCSIRCRDRYTLFRCRKFKITRLSREDKKLDWWWETDETKHWKTNYMMFEFSKKNSI